eukprot:7388811-Prymnesium_polylepis.1
MTRARAWRAAGGPPLSRAGAAAAAETGPHPLVASNPARAGARRRPRVHMRGTALPREHVSLPGCVIAA